MTLAVSRTLPKTFQSKVVQQSEPVKPKRIVKIEEEPVKPRRKVKIEEDHPSSYTKEEVATMNPLTVLAEFIRITGKNTLPCKHCAKKEKNVLTDWSDSIYVRALKVGLSVDMKLPKTCDRMQARNRICNPINNPVYYFIRNEKCEMEDKIEALHLRQELLENITSRPYQYNM